MDGNTRVKVGSKKSFMALGTGTHVTISEETVRPEKERIAKSFNFESNGNGTTYFLNSHLVKRVPLKRYINCICQFNNIK